MPYDAPPPYNFVDHFVQHPVVVLLALKCIKPWPKFCLFFQICTNFSRTQRNKTDRQTDRHMTISGLCLSHSELVSKFMVHGCIFDFFVVVWNCLPRPVTDPRGRQVGNNWIVAGEGRGRWYYTTICCIWSLDTSLLYIHSFIHSLTLSVSQSLTHLQLTRQTHSFKNKPVKKRFLYVFFFREQKI